VITFNSWRYQVYRRTLESILSRETLPEIGGRICAVFERDQRRVPIALPALSEPYARLARLPRPQLQPLELAGCVERAVSFETRVPVRVEPGPTLTVRGDPDQLEQVPHQSLAQLAPMPLYQQGTPVRIGLAGDGRLVEIWVEDEGPGLSSTANLFVPFFTTKPGGSGIGLVLSRQIAEGHGGALML